METTRRNPAGHSRPLYSLCAFPSPLGWFALITRGDMVLRLSFGHASRRAALAAIEPEWRKSCRLCPPRGKLVERLLAYAQGEPVDFRRVRVDLEPLGEFRRRVLRLCRTIPYGRTLTYGALAARVGAPRAARAVGQALATNPVPILIPCHRVVASDGRLGGFTAPGGPAMKRRLLELEGCEP